jgi:O-antigen/teichoic acid export membrane protein
MSLPLRKIGSNAFSLLTSDATNRGTSFVVYALVARHLGAFQFGQLALALSLFYVFQVTAVAGVKLLIVRQVAKDRSQTRLYFNNGVLIVTATSVASLALLFGFVRIMRYEAATSAIILLLSLGLLPFSISSVCEGIFQAWERMHYIAYVNVPANLLKMAGAFALLAEGRGLGTVIAVLLVAFFAVAVVEMWLVFRKLPVQPGPLSLAFSKSTLRSAFTFLAIDKVVAIESSLNIILLSKLATETQVGLYSAATQVMVPLALVYQSIAQSIYPVMCRKVEPGYRTLRKVAEQAAEALLALALPAVAGIYFLGDWLLPVLYKNRAFQDAVPVLRIIACILILQVFTSVLGQVLWATHREKVTLRIVIVDLLLNLAVGLPLIARYGLIGAAITLVVTRSAACIQHYLPVRRLLNGLSLSKMLWKSAIATACMAAYLAFVVGHASGYLDVLSAALIYGALLFVSFVFASGGIRQFRNKYLLSDTE